MFDSLLAAVLSYTAPYGVATELQLLHALAWAMIASGVSAFLALQVFVAPYGKYADMASPLYGPKINGKVAWIVQEAPAFFIPAYMWWQGATQSADPARAAALSSWSPQTALLSLFLFHYLNRTFIFPLRIRGGKPTPVVVMLMALGFCLWNGYLQGRMLTAYSSYDALTFQQPHFVLGVALFIVGLTINWQSDDILRNLRKPGDTRHYIPVGGMFEYVSGANFFGEILEWTGFAVAAWSLPAAAFALFTFCNIGPRGAQHHAWYRAKFKEDYPAARKAVIPFIW